MWPLSALAQQVIRGSHSIDIRATVYGADGSVRTGLPISGGTVTVDATSTVRRSATVNIADPALWPADPFDLLTPYGSEMALDYGIIIPGQGTEWIPLIMGGIQEDDSTLPATSGASITLSLADRSQRIADDRVAAPVQVGGDGSTTVVQAITALILGSYPDAVVKDLTANTSICPSLTVQQNRWSDGIEKLADAISAECVCDPTGIFLIRPQPTLGDPVAWTVSTGNRGVLVQVQRKRSRTDTYNAVVASGQQSDGTTPPTATVVDNDPTSPTYYYGTFGHKPRFYVSPLLTTVTQCTNIAQSLLDRVTGMDTQLSLSAITNPALDAGDVIRVAGIGDSLHIADQITIPLELTTTQQVTGRTTALSPEQVSS